MSKTQEEKSVERALPIERGHMFVLYRPKMQKVYVWLSPEKVKMADHVTHSVSKAAAAGGGGAEKEEEGGAAHKRKHDEAVPEKEHDAAAASKEEETEETKSKRAKTSQPPPEEAEKKAPVAKRKGRIQPGRPLHPDAKAVHAKHRLLVIPTKKLPTNNVRAPHWAFVEEVGSNVEAIKGHIGEFHYHTQTRGDRTNAAARIVAECLYEIVKQGDHTYLFYELEFPHEVTDVQKAFNIQQEGVMMVQVKNPHSSSENRYGEVVAGLSKKMKPEYPASLQLAFTGKRKAEVKFAALQPEMLNYKGSELLLLGVKSSPEAILGPDELEFMEKVAAQEAGAAKSDKAEHAAVSKMTGVGGEEIALEHW